MIKRLQCIQRALAGSFFCMNSTCRNFFSAAGVIERRSDDPVQYAVVNRLNRFMEIVTIRRVRAELQSDWMPGGVADDGSGVASVTISDFHFDYTKRKFKTAELQMKRDLITLIK